MQPGEFSKGARIMRNAAAQAARTPLTRVKKCDHFAMPQDTTSIRLARAEDARDIALMSRDLIEDGLGWRYDPARVQRLISAPDTVALVAGARLAERPAPGRAAPQRAPASGRAPLAGFAVMDFGDERAHLVLLAVRPAHRRAGVGRALLEWLVRSARTAGIASLHLELRASNLAARAFYRAMGFEETVEVPGYYRGPGGAREPALRMLRLLRAGDAAPAAWAMPKFTPGER